MTGVSNSPTGAVIDTGHFFNPLDKLKFAGCIVSLKFTPIRHVFTPLGGMVPEMKNSNKVIYRIVQLCGLMENDGGSGSRCHIFLS